MLNEPFLYFFVHVFSLGSDLHHCFLRYHDLEQMHPLFLVLVDLLAELAGHLILCLQQHPNFSAHILKRLDILLSMSSALQRVSSLEVEADEFPLPAILLKVMNKTEVFLF